MFGRKKKANLYDIQEERLLQQLNETDLGSDLYKELQAELKTTHQLRGDSRESRRKISKEAKGSLLGKLAGGGIVLTGLGLVSLFEMKGNTYTGEKRTFADSFVRLLGKFTGV